MQGKIRRFITLSSCRKFLYNVHICLYVYVIKIFINKTARKIQKDVIQYIIYQTKPKTITPETFKNIDRKIFMESQKKK